jgi:ubiquinone/menaquinone biosynthesis C-methylase UbiE
MPEVTKFLSKQDCKGWNVLEIGAGPDTTFRYLFESAGMKYTGIDVLPVTNGSNCYQGLMESLPFSTAKFDFIFACHAFEHCNRENDALKEFFRCLKKGGALFLLTPNYCEHHILRADEDHINVLTDLQMKRKLLYAGFREFSVYTSALDPKVQNHSLVTIAVKK